MTTITLDTSENAARAVLNDDGVTPGPELLRLAQRMLEGAEEALRDDPDVNASERGSELADTALAGYGAKRLLKDSPDVLDLDDEGLAEDGDLSQKIIAAVYVLLSRIASEAIEDNRPSMDDMEWDDAAPRPGYVLVGKSDDGFVYVQARLHERHGALELSLVGEYREGCGQMSLPDDLDPAPGWTPAEVRHLWAIWDRYHLNGMKAHCEHQRAIADRLGKRPFEIFTTANHRTERDDAGILRYTGDYGRGVDGKQASPARVRCVTCGYSYGSAWRSEPLPAAVVDFIESHFPMARTVPA